MHNEELKMETLRTIKYNAQIAVRMDKIAQKLGRPNRLVFAQMVDYFFRSKKDPLDINDELLKNTLLKQHKDYIGFIRTQENDLLIPIKREVDRMTGNQGDINNLLRELDKKNITLVNGQGEILSAEKNYSSRLSNTDEILKNIMVKLSTKEQLKKQFHYILGTYIKGREAFSMMTSAKEKEELIRITKNQIDLL
ncbi:BfmA/BtgA family mobilization protein [uncultured Pedobacter sp.]|uniref:BfmA/BtgA family mobilization protein n=1 Tax=uncultured Pedobacter sp. TaxID=246139 RepID=UPI0025F5E0E6|nr:BfmA/BtgA family mobilization protein [uncultured Pedobacter sp.]